VNETLDIRWTIESHHSTIGSGDALSSEGSGAAHNYRKPIRGSEGPIVFTSAGLLLLIDPSAFGPMRQVKTEAS
jgi:hypothetical protein